MEQRDATVVHMRTQLVSGNTIVTTTGRAAC